MSSEQERIERLTLLFGASEARGVRKGVGDDAAVLEPSRSKLVWTVDAAVEDVHFRRAHLRLEEIGHRSMMAAASDLAAMGAVPLAALSALILPPGFSDDELDELARGQERAARSLGMPVVGGNLSRGRELSITTTVLGEVERTLLRDGARAGDIVALAGPVGLAKAGFSALERSLTSAELAPALEAFRRPRALIREGLTAAEHAHAAIDVSDGLALDASRMASASGVGIVLDASALLHHGGTALESAARILGEDPLELALEGGEDYALLIACPAEKLPEGFTAVGELIEERGLFLRDRKGLLHPRSVRGFDHFAQSE